MLSSIIFWGSSTPPRSISYTDSLFLVVSAMTLAGLNTVNLSILNTFQQFILFLLIMLGSAIFVSIAVVHVRRKAFERRFKSIVEEERQRRRDRSVSRQRLSFGKSTSQTRPEVDGVVVRGRAIKAEKRSSENLNGSAVEDTRDSSHVDGHPTSVAETKPKPGTEDTLHQRRHAESDASKSEQPLAIDTGVARRITFASPTSPNREREHGRLFDMQGVGARQSIQNHPLHSGRSLQSGELPPINEGDIPSPGTAHHGFNFGGFIGRNSQFSSLDLSQREKLGGVEYRAVTILAVIVPIYFILWQLLGCIGLGAYVATKRPDVVEVDAENPW